MRRGEVWWTNVGGKRRPAVILTRDAALPLLNRVTVAPATTRTRGIPSEIELEAKVDGVPTACVLTLDNVTTVPKSDLSRRSGMVRPAKLVEICDVLGYALGC